MAPCLLGSLEEHPEQYVQAPRARQAAAARQQRWRERQQRLRDRPQHQRHRHDKPHLRRNQDAQCASVQPNEDPLGWPTTAQCAAIFRASTCTALW